MRTLHSSERGTSVAEFLIFAPFLVFLIYGIYFLNEHIDDAIDVSVENRVSLFQGNIPVFPVQVNRAPEPDPNKPPRLPKDVKFNGSFDYQKRFDEDRDLLTSHVEKSPKKFDSTYSGLDKSTATILSSAFPPRSAFYTLVDLATGLKAKDSMRISELESLSKFDKSDLMQGLLTLETEITKEPSTAHEFHHLDRLYLYDLNNYHPATGIRSAISGYGIGLMKNKHWGAKGSFASDSDHFVTRCMARLTQENTCENSPGSFKRSFAYKLSLIIDAKIAVSIALAVETWGVSFAFEYLITDAVKEVLFSAVESLLTEFSTKLIEEMKKKALSNIDHFFDTKQLEESFDKQDIDFGNLLNLGEGP